MTALAFLAAMTATFVLVLAFETAPNSTLNLRRPTGLLTWLTRGNWPAKIGGTLVIVGVGALLRYAFIHIEIAAQLKLGLGFVLAAALGLASLLIPTRSATRPVSLALGGASFGVAYLTAYSAFGIYDYLSNPTGLALLLLTSVGAATFAITRSALSLAILSMIGAFLAPAFAAEGAGPTIVYGYYIAASLLTLLMVAMRGWRPLIHLNFLFTLAGSLFFAWTKQYNTPQYADVMLPVLLILAALHIAMPVFEKPQKNNTWIERLDLVYLLAVPLAAAFSALNIAPNRLVLSNELFGLAGVWAYTAIALRICKRDGSSTNALIAALFLLTGFAARFGSLPWELLLLTISVIALAFAAWRQPTATRLHSILAGLVLLLGAIHLLSLTAAINDSSTLANGVFLERLAGAILIICAGVICRKVAQALDTLLLAVGIGWAVLILGSELIRLDLATFAIVAHWVLILLGASLWIPGRRVQIVDRHVPILATAILASAAWATTGTLSPVVGWANMFGSALVLIAVAIRPTFSLNHSVDGRIVAALMAPAVAAVWAFKVSELSNIGAYQFVYLATVFIALSTLLSGRLVDSVRAPWLHSAANIFALWFTALLAFATLVDIERSVWAIALELLCLVSLTAVCWLRLFLRRPADISIIATLAGLGLLLQAHIMRWFGPDGDLNITDLFAMSLPALISLLWAVVGAGLTLWARKIHSQPLWSVGAGLLVAAAIKVLLIDFGALGQLANILAVIAAGITFLLVGWLAPMPPTQDKTKASRPLIDNAVENGKVDGCSKFDWTIALVIIGAVAFFQFSHSTQVAIRDTIVKPMSINYESSDVQTPEDYLPKKVIQAEDIVLAEEVIQAEKIIQPVEAIDAEEVTQSEEAIHTPLDTTLVKTEKSSLANQDGYSATEITDFESARKIPLENAISQQQTQYIDARETEESIEAKLYEKPIKKTPPKPYTVSRDERGVLTYTQTTESIAENFSTTQPSTSVSTPDSVEQQIEKLIRQGRLRPATFADIAAWHSATGRTYKKTTLRNTYSRANGSEYVFRTYVVLRDMTFPQGLYGSHSATFIIPRHVALPQGNYGHSRIFKMPI